MTRKMTKDIKFMVAEVNEWLATEFMQNNDIERKTLFAFVEHIIMSKNMYHGFDYYKPAEPGSRQLVPAGQETRLLQFEIR